VFEHLSLSKASQPYRASPAQEEARRVPALRTRPSHAAVATVHRSERKSLQVALKRAAFERPF
jgi:hypothetical protein